MGTIARFDLSDLIPRWGLKHFVETGTGRGDSLAYAASVTPGFIALRSCELEPRLSAESAQRFRGDRRVRVFTERSSTFLRWACQMLPADEPILFFLDAHFPGADYGLRGYADESDDGTRLPLAEELRLIAKHRPLARDVVAVDDLRIYLDGPFQHGNLPAELRPLCPKRRGVDFVHAAMGATHDVALLYEHEGYLLLTPKEQEDGRGHADEAG